MHAKVEPARADKEAPRGCGEKAGRQVVVEPAIDDDDVDDDYFDGLESWLKPVDGEEY